MKCGSCEKKCGNAYCAFSYNLIEACQSGKPFYYEGMKGYLRYINDCGAFNYILDQNDNIYKVTQQDFFREWRLI